MIQRDIVTRVFDRPTPFPVLIIAWIVTIFVAFWIAFFDGVYSLCRGRKGNG